MSGLWRVGLVGCGNMGAVHALSCTAMPEVRLVAIADIVPEALEGLGTMFDVPADQRFTDYLAMYDEVRPDIVIVSTRALQHFAPTVAALERGIHVLCEKPMAADLTEADAMIAASERTGAKLGVNTQRRTDPYYRHAVRLVREGKIGELRAVRCESKHGASSFTMMDRGSHFFDVMRMFAGDAEWVFAHVTNGDGRDVSATDIQEGRLDLGFVAGESCTSVVGFGDGVRGTYEFWRGVGEYGFEVIGSAGILRIAQEATEVLFSPGTHWRTENSTWESVPVQLTEEERAALAVRRWSSIGTIRAVIKGVQEDTIAVPSGYDGRAALEIIMACYVSHRVGARVHLPLPNRQHPLRAWCEAASVAGVT